MSNRTRIIFIHILCGIAFLSLPVFFAPGGESLFDKLQNPGTLRDLTGYAFVLLFFYLHYFVLIPRLFFQKKHAWYFFSVLVCFVLTMYHPSPSAQSGPPGPPPGFSQNGPLPNPTGRPGDLFGNIQHNLLRFSLVFFISLLLKTNERWGKTEQEKMEGELSFLRAQINPHFLFNTLNSIYALAIEKSDGTADAVARLSGMMRYVTGEANRDSVPLEKELEYLSNYVELQKIRLGNTARLEFSVIGTGTGKKIAPLLLISFIENAFKYGVNPEEDSPIRIAIEVGADDCRLEVFNRKVKLKSNGETTTGVGLKNTRDRLNLLYPGRHSLDITEDEATYSVSLTIRLE